MVNRQTNKNKQKRRTIKGGSGILTYALNSYDTDTQLDGASITSRQMYNEQTVMNPRVLGGGRRKTQKRRGEKKRGKKGGKTGKKGSRNQKENCPY